MDELISRAAAIETAIDAVDDWDGGYNPNREEVIRKYFEIVPAVDVVPVVRCKDCKHCYFAANRMHEEQCLVCDKYGIDVINNWFCADGERVESE